MKYQQIVPISRDTDSCNARDLHAAFGVESRFNDWVANRIEQYGFVEGEDFYSNLSKSTGGRPTTEYSISTDMAKELAMVEGNDTGRAVRRYFIAAEKELVHRLEVERQVNLDFNKASETGRRKMCVDLRLSNETLAAEVQTLKQARERTFPKSHSRRMEILDFFDQQTTERVSADKYISRGPLVGTEVTNATVIRLHRCLYIDLNSAARFFGMSLPGLKKSIRGDDKIHHNGVVYCSVGLVPHPYYATPAITPA